MRPSGPTECSRNFKNMGNALLFRYQNVTTELPSDFEMDKSYGVWGVYTAYGEVYGSGSTDTDTGILYESSNYMIMYSNGGYKWYQNFVTKLDWWDKSKLKCGNGSYTYATIKSLLSQYSQVWYAYETDRVRYTTFYGVIKVINSVDLSIQRSGYLTYNTTYSKGSLLRYTVSTNPSKYPTDGELVVGNAEEETRWYSKIV